MKIAVCLSGQWRTGNYCYDNLKRFFGILYPYCDFFIHTWDVNKQKCYNLSNVFSKEAKLTDDEISELKNKYKPKKIVIENYYQTHETLKRYEPSIYVDIKFFDIIQPLWYSFWKSIQLKKQYEIENGFEYDYVIKLRPDVVFSTDRRLVQDIELYKDEIDAGEFYIENLMREWTIDSTTVDDVYFLSKSYQMDIAAEYYTKWIEWGIIDSPLYPFYGFLRHSVLNDLKICKFKKRYLGGEYGYVVQRPECLEYGNMTLKEYRDCQCCEDYYYGNPIDNPKTPKGFYIDYIKSKYEIDNESVYYIEDLIEIKSKKLI
jgi:hypothetical protein